MWSKLFFFFQVSVLKLKKHCGSDVFPGLESKILGFESPIFFFFYGKKRERGRKSITNPFFFWKGKHTNTSRRRADRHPIREPSTSSPVHSESFYNVVDSCCCCCCVYHFRKHAVCLRFRYRINESTGDDINNRKVKLFQTKNLSFDDAWRSQTMKPNAGWNNKIHAHGIIEVFLVQLFIAKRATDPFQLFLMITFYVYRIPYTVFKLRTKELCVVGIWF